MVDLARKYANDPIMRKVQLGIDVTHFVTKDPVGMYLIERAHQCRIQALEDLATIDPKDAGAIAKLQMDARIPGYLMRWLEEAAAEGIAAEETAKALDAVEVFE